MDGILNDGKNASKLLALTAGTIFLLDEQGVCVDIMFNGECPPFFKEQLKVGVNLLNILPPETYKRFYPEFRMVETEKIISSASYEILARQKQYCFHCTMKPYENMVLCHCIDVTERNKRQQELGKRNRELSEIQKIAMIGDWYYTSKDGNLRYKGQSGALNLVSQFNITLERYRRFILPDDLKLFDMWVKNVLKGDLKETFDFRILMQKKIYYLRAKALAREKNRDGSIMVEGYVQNVTEVYQKRNDISLLTHAINNAAEDIYAADEEGNLVFINRLFQQHHNISGHDDITRMKIYEVNSHFKSKQDWEEYVDEVKHGMRVHGFRISNPTPLHPEILAMESYAYWVTSDSGVGTIWSFARDISQRIEQERQLRHFNLILNKTIENLPASIVVKDINNDFRYLYRNKESFNRDINQSDPIGKSDFDFHTYDVAVEKRIEDMEIARTGIEKHWISEDRDSEGNVIYIDKRKLKIESEDLPPLLLNIDWDITSMERMKRELIVAKEKAETSDRLKSAFLANMSHEIRTPLNAIVGFSRIIAETEDATERQTYYEIVEENNNRLLQLINEILDLSKIEANITEFKIRSVSLHELCREVYNSFYFRCPENVELVFDTSDLGTMVRADKSRVIQILSNLIGNAMKFTKEGSIRFGYWSRGNEVELHVTDTGVGISEENQKKVFDRFVKANDMEQGTGLGLSICKMLVEKMGGRISVESILGKGTTFRFTLPKAMG